MSHTDNAYMGRWNGDTYEIDTNIEPVDPSDAGLNRVLDAIARPSVGRSQAELTRAKRWAELLKQVPIVRTDETLDLGRPDRFEGE